MDTIILLFFLGIGFYFFSILFNKISKAFYKDSSPFTFIGEDKLPIFFSVIISIIFGWMLFYLLIIRLCFGWYLNGPPLLPYYMYFFFWMIVDSLVYIIKFAPSNKSMKLKFLFFYVKWNNFRNILRYIRYIYVTISFVFFFFRAIISLDSFNDYGYAESFNSEEPIDRIQTQLWDNLYLASWYKNSFEIYKRKLLIFKKQLATGNEYSFTEWFSSLVNEDCKLIYRNEFLLGHDNKIMENCDGTIYIISKGNSKFEMYFHDRRNDYRILKEKDELLFEFETN